MTATLPSSLLVGHIMSDSEWNQIITALTCMSNLVIFNSRPSATTTSTTYTNITGGSTSMFKFYDSSTSDIGILFFGCGRSGTVNGILSFGINDGFTDWDLTAMPGLTANKRYSQGGFTRITGLGVGGVALQLRFKHSTSATAITVDGNDTQSFLAIEMPK